MNDIEIENLIKESLKKAFECYTCGDYSQAEELYRQILRVDRHNMDALEIGSLTICQNGKPDEAKEWAVKALSRDHNNFKLYNNLGLIHGSLKEHDQAIRCFKIAINKEPSEAFLYSNLAIQHKSRGQLEEACKVIEEAIDKGNESDHLYFNYGAIVHEFGMYKKAINLYKKAIKINPEMAISHYNLSACQLLLGDYENGWKEYEWRWKQFEKFATIRNKFSKPYYEGQSLKNKTIVLYCEQGIGDAIMMSRYIPTLKNMGARIVLETTLTELFEQFNVELTTNYEGEYDYHCSLLSLPGILETSICGKPYLTCDKKDLDGDFKVGICWAGSPFHPNDKNRSIPLNLFEGMPGTIYSFQKDKRPHVYPDFGVVDYSKSSMEYIDLSEEMSNMKETGDLLLGLDLLVTADTSVVHLAGALGVKTFLLIPYCPDWRWGLESKTDWYDSVTIFRQKEKGNWIDVIEDVKKRADSSAREASLTK